MADWLVPAAKGPVVGSFRVPASKSIHQRALALAVLAEGTSTIEADGASPRDVVLFGGAVSGLVGREIPPVGPIDGAFAGGGLGTSRRSVAVGLGMNATGFRIATALSCLRPAGARTLLRGDRRLLDRPHGPLLRAIEALGGHAHRKASGSVRVIAGGISGGKVAIDASRSSQFATALMIGATRWGGLELRLEGEPASEAYLELTERVLGQFGVDVERSGGVVRVPRTPPRAARVRVESDASAAAVWWTVAALTGGSVVVAGVSEDSRQPDARLLTILERMGATTGASSDGVRVTGPAGGLKGLRGAGDVDLRASPDLAPLVAALAAGASGETRVIHAAHLKLKESDRIASVVEAVRALHGDAEAREDGFLVRGRALVGGRVDAARDHRLVLAFGALGMAVPGVMIAGSESVSKSYPGFPAAVARAAEAEAAQPE